MAKIRQTKVWVSLTVKLPARTVAKANQLVGELLAKVYRELAVKNGGAGPVLTSFASGCMTVTFVVWCKEKPSDVDLSRWGVEVLNAQPKVRS
jgi:hypothetical protein